MPKWLKWALWLSLGFLGLVVALVICVREQKPEFKSWDQWRKHREYIESMATNVMIAKDALTVHARANNYYQDKFYQTCGLAACTQYKSFIRAARDASADGRLTPEELTQIAERQQSLKAALDTENDKMKSRFQK